MKLLMLSEGYGCGGGDKIMSDISLHLPQDIETVIAAAKIDKREKNAKKSLELTIKYLERLNPNAARSLEEDMEETLTVHRLGIKGLLKKTFSSTNPIESCFSITRTITGRVKRWQKGDMVQRWAIAALLRAEKRFNRVKGYGEIPKLTVALQKKSLEGKEVAA